MTSYMSELEAENQVLRAELKKLHRRDAVMHLLLGQYPDENHMLCELRELGFEFSNLDYMIVFFSLEVDKLSPLGKSQSFSFKELSDKTEAKAAELFGQKFETYVIHIEKGCVCLLGLDKDYWYTFSPSEGLIPHVEQLCEQLWRWAEGEHRAALSISTSRPMSGISGITTAYQDILRINEYRSVMTMTKPILSYLYFEAIEDPGTVSYRRIKIEKTYIECIENDNYIQARHFMHELIKMEFRDSSPTLQNLQIKITSKLNLLLCALEKFQGAGYHLNELYNLVDPITSNNVTVNAMTRLIDEVFDYIEAFIAEQKNTKQPSWLPMILNYVELHYRDENLNVESVAAHFGMNPTYISRQLKANLGCGMFDYIQRVRVSYASPLIERGFTLRSTAKVTGFSNVKALRRAIVKQTGSLPSEIIEISKREALA